MYANTRSRPQSIGTPSAAEAAFVRSCPERGWKQSFMLPTGLLGRAAGRIMAFKNASMNRLTA